MAITNFIPTVWSEKLLRTLDTKYVGAANCNREFEGEIREKGNKVKICGLNNVIIGAYTKNTDMKAPSVLTDTATELVIDQAKYFNFQIDDIDRAQSTPQLMDAALKNAASALAAEADRYIYTLAAQNEALVTVDEITPETIMDILIDARTRILAQNVSDPSDIVIEVTPEVAGVILKAKLDLCNDNTALMETGCIGSIGGCKIYVTSHISRDGNETTEYHQCIARTRRAIAYAEQLSEIEAYRPELRFADAMKGLHLYGAKTVYPNEVVVLNLGFPIEA